MALQKSETDPRVKRTRQLLQDAFTSLIKEKDFESITVSDITTRATVNRATFYAHFADKFEMLESKINEIFMAIVTRRASNHTVLNEETLESIFLAVCDFHKGLSTLCRRSYKSLGPIFETQIKEKIQAMLLSLMKNDEDISSPEKELFKDTAAILLSWGMYGAAYVWNSAGCQVSAESYVKQAMPLIMNGAKEFLNEGVHSQTGIQTIEQLKR